MFFDYNSQKPRPAEQVAKASGSFCPRTSGDPSLGTTTVEQTKVIVVLEETLESPWTAKRTNQSILKEINPECSLDGQILKLRLQYFGHLMRREDFLEKTLMLGKCEGKRRRGQQRTRWLDSVTEATNMNLTNLREAVGDRRAWCALVHGVTKSPT